MTPCPECRLRPGERCAICGAEGERERRLRPAPCLQALIAAFGSWPAIPVAAWAAYDRELARWQAAVREGRAEI